MMLRISQFRKKRFPCLMKFFFVFLLSKIDVISGLYFPQSKLTLRLPQNPREAGQYNENLMILNLRVLTNDSSKAEAPEYQILSDIDESVELDPWTNQVRLRSLPEKGKTKMIVIQAKELDGVATIEINIESIDNEGSSIDCANFMEDLCFWKVSKYKIYEGQPETMLGNIGSDVYKTLCPDYQITHYELLNGTNYFTVMDRKLYAYPMLDRDTQFPGPHVDVRVRCIIYENKTGRQYIHEKNLDIDVLDVDDNPPITQTERNITIKLKDFSAGDRLDENDLILRDADSMQSNLYNVQILDDIHDALKITFSTMEVEHPNIIDPPSTVIYARIYSKKTLLPISPYKVILQVEDVTLLPGQGEKSVNISIMFVGPQHQSISSTTFAPVIEHVVFNTNTSIPRSSSMLFRVAQPESTPQTSLIFSIPSSKIFGITPTEGIIYIANPSMLRNAPDEILLTIQWIASEQKKISSTNMTINVVNTSKQLKDSSCSDQILIMSTCAKVGTKKACESRCGMGSGTFSAFHQMPGCIWRSPKVPATGLTSIYETCSPNLLHCPDFVCDELEKLDMKICPQDCTTMEPHFGILNKNQIGLHKGIEICRCDEQSQCSCGSDSSHDAISIWDGKKNIANGSKDVRDSKVKKERTKSFAIGHVIPKTRVATGSRINCGPSCLVVIICSTFGAMFLIGGAISWRYKCISRPRRDSKFGSDDIYSDGRTFSLDYFRRNNRNRAAQEALANANSLLPKPITPDPKWEFPRSRLIIEQMLGEGEFGKVLKARAVDISPWPGALTVAVKTLKEDASASELGDLLSEYELLKEAHHPNVIKLLGACTTPDAPIYLIIEFAEFGSLRNFLRRTRHIETEQVACSASFLSESSPMELEAAQNILASYTIEPRDILSFALQISKGMAYLSDIKLVHRDLAARNVLLATGKVCKISDFGLTRDIYEDDTYLKRSKGRVPVKWMAPESLADHVYTSKSDVWSFGVLLWELVTLGASPYPGIDVHNLYSLLKAGYRMTRPTNCSTDLYKIMIMCWHDEACMRPSFKELINNWEQMLKEGIDYINLTPQAVHNQGYIASLQVLDRATSKPGSNSVHYMNILASDPIDDFGRYKTVEKFWELPLSPPPHDFLKTYYVNENLENMKINHYESPIKPKKLNILNENENIPAASSNERSQPYMDMEGRNAEKLDLLLSNSDTNERDAKDERTD